jgi:hypothetical protein
MRSAHEPRQKVCLTPDQVWAPIADHPAAAGVGCPQDAHRGLATLLKERRQFTERSQPEPRAPVGGLELRVCEIDSMDLDLSGPDRRQVTDPRR